MDHPDSVSPERFAAILENQRAIMVNQSTILHNQNKIMRGVEQILLALPSSQNNTSALSTQNTVSLASQVHHLASVQPALPHVPEPPRVEQASLTQITITPAQTKLSGLQQTHTRVESQLPTCTVTTVPVIPPISQNPLPSPTLVTVHPAPVPIPITNANSSPDSSDDERPQFASRSAVMQIKCKSCSIGNFSVQLLRYIFQGEELSNKNCSGTRGKEQIDPVKLQFIKQTVYEHYNIPTEEKATTWRHCIRAMDEFLRRPKKERKYMKDNSPPTLVGLGMESKLGNFRSDDQEQDFSRVRNENFPQTNAQAKLF
ncbi:predicted protein [Nematostella vectensis]|uniref:BEN domain-containing protein n=1 Tax=Nematostella vectensis TaxID=45351 RepID=A7S9R0_NEMVE|nr:predicted protein [Nematostella vectensis]|eukprot:XP_001631588.1 predicted protein [Nematostella vectensis]